MRVATLLLLLLVVAVAASAVDLCSQSFCACPDAGKRVVCKCDGVKVSFGLFYTTSIRGHPLSTYADFPAF